MSSATLTFASTRTSSDELERLAEAFDAADAVLVGAGAGLSTAAGHAYDGPRFERHLAAWRERYGFADMYSGGFYPYDTVEEYWGFWSTNILVNRYEAGPSELYRSLVDSLAEKDHFVITTNVDHQFQLAGLSPERLFYTQGDYGLMQCPRPCHQRTYPNEDEVRAMAAAVGEKLRRQRAAGVPGRLLDLSVPDELVPRCPVCGEPMAVNLRCDQTFVEGEGWQRAAARYERFCEQHRRDRVLYLELGVGQNTPGIIKYPFWRRAAANPRATYVCVSQGEAYAPEPLAARSVLLDTGAQAAVDALAAVAPVRA